MDEAVHWSNVLDSVCPPHHWNLYDHSILSHRGQLHNHPRIVNLNTEAKGGAILRKGGQAVLRLSRISLAGFHGSGCKTKAK